MKTIRLATLSDINDILSIYDCARRFMRKTGNMTQWTGGYPSREVIESDISNKSLYLCEENSMILAVFNYTEGEDPTYRKIYNGTWLNVLPYAVIHRIAVSEQARGTGVSGFIFDHCFEKCRNLKIDTHKDNLPMQRALEKNGFIRCGIIYLLSGDERIAYQRCQ